MPEWPNTVSAAEIERLLDAMEHQAEGAESMHGLRQQLQERLTELVRSEQAARQEAAATRAQADAAIKALAESEQRYRYMGETIPFGVWWCNPQGEAEYVSPSFCELLNMTLEEQRKFGWTQRLVPEDVEPMMTKWLHCCETGTPWDHEHRIIDRYGKVHTVLSRGLPVRDDGGSIIAWVGVNLDITARKQIELQLQEAKDALEEAMHVKDQFLANISHELRTPLTLVLGPVRKTLSAGNLTEEQQHDLGVVERNARTLLKNVNDLLDLSKLDAGRMRIEYAEIDLARLARFVASHFESVADDKQIRFAVETPQTLPAQVDPEKLQRVLFNLLSNAFKFTPSQGAVRLRLESRNGQALIAAEDTGPGIPPAMRQVIFERFRQVDSSSTRRYGGTGLGLAIAKEFVNLHHGTIGVTEAPTGGARFTVEIPLAAPGGTDVKVAGPAADEEGAREAVAEFRTQVGLPTRHDGLVAPNAPLVLIVEDNPEMNAFIAESLADRYRVATAFDGQEGLEKATEHQPDLIVSDIMMPRMSGEDLVREVRRRRELDDIPILLLTAKADENLRVQLLSNGAQDCLVKPFLAEELVARAGGLIARKRKAEASLRQSYALLHAVTEGVTDAIFVKDAQGRYLMINAAGAQRLGRSVPEVLGKDDTALFDLETATRIRADDQKIMAQGQTLTFEETRTATGATRTYLTTKGPYRDYEGRVVGALGISLDITDRKRAEEQLRSLNETLEQRVAERTAELEHRAGQLRALAAQLTQAEQKERQRVAYILHEHFQQLLVGAKFNLSMIDTPGQDPFLVSSLREVDRILDQAIEGSRSLAIELSPPMLRHARMSDVLRWLGRWMQQKHGLAVRVKADDQADPQDPQVRELLFRAVRELLLNVVKSAQVDQATVEMARGDSQHVQITVSDEGVGFDVANYLADASVDKGFGLFSLQERLELLGGRMAIDSAPGQGTRITLHAPGQVIADAAGG